MTPSERQTVAQLALELKRVSERRYRSKPESPSYPWVALGVLLAVAVVAFMLMEDPSWLSTARDEWDLVRRTARALLMGVVTVGLASVCILLRELSVARAAYDEAISAEEESAKRSAASVEVLNKYLGES